MTQLRFEVIGIEKNFISAKLRTIAGEAASQTALRNYFEEDGFQHGFISSHSKEHQTRQGCIPSRNIFASYTASPYGFGT